MATKSVSVTIRGGGSEEGKKQEGEGKDFMATKRFLVATRAW